ncbi:MAG: hypothetical protein Q8N23_20530 [Archangium sp.]|nr:hypothetical protein [Archangium sp.]MDP3155078.1 hypothetical protein [Archangium sp.]MDP3572070.1 hypothetical protein [Archangium sp.]
MKKVWLVKGAGTAVVTVLMLRPWFVDGDGVIETVRSFGVLPALFCTAVFFAAVALYCSSLERALTLVTPGLRAMKPASVWFMYVPFFNIVEDFFIIEAVTRSLEAQARIDPRLGSVRHFGRFTGLGWCSGQALALWPSVWGEIASVTALALWLLHWVTIHQLNRRLARHGQVKQPGQIREGTPESSRSPGV